MVSVCYFENMSAKGDLRKKTSHRIIWTPAEESILLDLWEEKIEDLRGARKNSHVFQEMVAKLQEAGFEGSWSDVRTKLDNLTRKYKEERKKIGPTGGAPCSWDYYVKIHSILGSFRTVSAYEQMHESSDMSSLLDESIEIEVASCSRVVQSDADCAPRKRKKANANEELLELARERHAMQKERGALIENLVTTLNSIASQNASFQKDLLQILREKN